MGRAGWHVLTVTDAIAVILTLILRPVIFLNAAPRLPDHVFDPVPGLHFSRSRLHQLWRFKPDED